MLDRLIPQGLFLDGVTYAAIARNLAIGKGTFWELYYRNEWPFASHPPLMFGMQAFFFKVFGDHYLTEKTYSFIIWLISTVIIHQLWKQLGFARHSSALPILLWCIVPTITWGYTNNILDCTMSMFDLAAVLMIVNVYTGYKGKGLIHIIMAGLMVFAAMFSKGPTGAFPIVTPLLYWLCFRKSSTLSAGKIFLHTAIMPTVVITCYIGLYQIPGAKLNLERYFNQQLVASLSGMKEITGGVGRFTVLIDLFLQLIVPAGVVIILLIINRRIKRSAKNEAVNIRAVILFTLIGLSASLPLMLSVKQRTFYLIPSLPYFVIAISIIAYPTYKTIAERFNTSQKALRSFAIISGIIALGLFSYLATKVGDIGRDKELITNIQSLQNKFPQGQVFGICPEMDFDYGFLAYLQRYNEMEVNPVFYTQKLLLVDKQICNSSVPEIAEQIGYHEITSPVSRYAIYKRKFPLHFDFMLLNPVFRRGDK